MVQKIKLQNKINIQSLIDDMGFIPKDNFKLCKKVYCKDGDDNKNFYELNLLTRELTISLQSNWLDRTIYDLIINDFMELE